MCADRYLRFVKEKLSPHGGRPLLWPVRVWKILYPTKRVQKLNLFQQAILGLALARCRDNSEMADLLGLDRDLVAFIIATQLIPSGWMTSMGGVTTKGERVLEEAQEVSDEMRIGYAYQDGISGNWLPRFTEELPEIEATRIDERGYPIFQRDRDSGKEGRPFRLSHFQDGALNKGALFDALRRYRTDHDHAKQRDDELTTRLGIESMSLVGDSGQVMWLWTWIFAGEAGVQPWLVADPFGLQQAASWLRKPLQEVLRQNEVLARYIANVIGETRSPNLSAEEWLRSLENRIDLTLQGDYSWSRRVPLVEKYLASVLRKRAQLEAQERALPEDLTSLLIETHNLAESVLQWILKMYPADIRRLPNWKSQRDWKDGEAQNYLHVLSLSCLTDDAIKRLAEQRLDQVRTAVKSGRSSLKALLFAGLLGTIDQVDHPFLELSAKELNLGFLLDMADARNKKAGHSGWERVEREDAMKYADFVIKWIQIFKDRY